MASPKDAMSMVVSKDTVKDTAKTTTAKDTKILGLSMAEARIILLATLCYEKSPKMDWDKLVAKSGYTFRSAQVTFNKARRTFASINDSDCDGTLVKSGTIDAAIDNDGVNVNVGDAPSSSPAPSKSQAKPKKATRKRGFKKTLEFEGPHNVVSGMSEELTVPSTRKRKLPEVFDNIEEYTVDQFGMFFSSETTALEATEPQATGFEAKEHLA
ncbi:hypothetical protein N7495_009859 [Penicillium taxi]|uniref:uncharacterized protein n=1 Tax=Penicillium taxi TaxID=168475 RepID=UPI0025459F2A|nr:uncharacterized protein N7495_009859 [Penicillium taxi]KAJ5885349.1 hypothetical protein N7495_009859 [Penicillium taxi]